MTKKIWTLEEARKDYNRKQLHNSCINCEFCKEIIYQPNFENFYRIEQRLVDKCEVKEKIITNLTTAKVCEYFTLKEGE